MVLQEGNVEFSNNLVAQSDYEAALEAISSTFDSYSLRTERDNDDGDWDTSNENERNIDHRRLVQEIFETAKQSMMKNLERIVRPIADRDYQDYVDQYHVVLDDSDDDSDEGGAYKQELAEADNDADGEDDEIDEEELLDIDAWNSARHLREKIRALSGNVQGIRDRILDQADKVVVATSLAPHLPDKRVMVREDDQLFLGDNSDCQNNESLDKENVDSTGSITGGMSLDQAQALHGSLQKLSHLLRDPQWQRLPGRIQSLQDTIEAIHKETSENRLLSKVEVAIQSRSNEMLDNDLQASRKLIENDTISTANVGDSVSLEALASKNILSAVDRLALFGQFYA